MDTPADFEGRRYTELAGVEEHEEGPVYRPKPRVPGDPKSI